jgi:hypothetical protein
MEVFKPTYNGIVEDTRSDKEKAKDWDSREIALGTGRGSKITTPPLPPRDQQQTGSCTAHAVIRMFEYNKVLDTDVSRLSLYRKRFNFPLEGSNATDLITKSHSTHHAQGGLSKDIQYPRTFDEAFANSLPFVIGSNISKNFNYFTIRDWNELEKTVNSGVAVTMAFYSTVNEWSREWVEERDTVTPNNAKVRHQITLIPHGAFTQNGKLWFSIDDSSKFGNRFLRYATLDFLRNRVIVQPQFALPKQDVVIDMPKVKKTLSACKMGDKGQAVTNLQGFLADNGFLEKKYITSFYGQITSNAILHFQLYYHKDFKDSIPELLKLKGEFFGSQSIAVAKKISTQ